MRSAKRYVGLKIEIYFSRMQQLFLEAHLHYGKWIQYYGQPTFEKDAYFTGTGRPLQSLAIFEAMHAMKTELRTLTPDLLTLQKSVNLPNGYIFTFWKPKIASSCFCRADK